MQIEKNNPSRKKTKGKSQLFPIQNESVKPYKIIGEHKSGEQKNIMNKKLKEVQNLGENKEQGGKYPENALKK